MGYVALSSLDAANVVNWAQPGHSNGISPACTAVVVTLVSIVAQRLWEHIEKAFCALRVEPQLQSLAADLKDRVAMAYF